VGAPIRGGAPPQKLTIGAIQKNQSTSIISAALANGQHLQSHLFDDHWEDIGTIKAFYAANLALVDEDPVFRFYYKKASIYTRSHYLPPSQLSKAEVIRSLISEGCQLDWRVIKHSVLGLRLRVETDVVLRDTLVMGADRYESADERAAVRASGGVPLGIGARSRISQAILDKNVRIGADVQIINKDHVQEADRQAIGFTIRNGIVVIEKNATIPDHTVIWKPDWMVVWTGPSSSTPLAQTTMRLPSDEGRTCVV
jgi:glucose-1-phosphate adenylyltransferase